MRTYVHTCIHTLKPTNWYLLTYTYLLGSQLPTYLSTRPPSHPPACLPTYIHTKTLTHTCTHQNMHACTCHTHCGNTHALRDGFDDQFLCVKGGRRKWRGERVWEERSEKAGERKEQKGAIRADQGREQRTNTEKDGERGREEGLRRRRGKRIDVWSIVCWIGWELLGFPNRQYFK